VLDPIWRDKQETAARLRARMASVLDWCKARDYRAGDNPAVLAELRIALPPRQKSGRHHQAVPHAELPDFMVKLCATDSVAARALEFTILTACRTGEVIGATAGEFDLNRALWTIPGSRMKAGKEHRVPLSEAAVAMLGVLTEGQNSDALVFDKLSSLAMPNVLAKLAGKGATVHGMRAAFRTWAEEIGGFDTHRLRLDGRYHRQGRLGSGRGLGRGRCVGRRPAAAHRRGPLLVWVDPRRDRPPPLTGGRNPRSRPLSTTAARLATPCRAPLAVAKSINQDSARRARRRSKSNCAEGGLITCLNFIS
jgi:hypothetical protein